jgi:putative pyruvate formate lyase activating enzyme
LSCKICPRHCTHPSNFCGENSILRAALAALHFGEEPPLVGHGGSGTIFLSGCNMKCPFCQNWQISRGEIGGELSIEQMARLMIKLQSNRATNINFVTGSHFSPGLIQASLLAKQQGLIVPILWNSSAYEKVQTLESLSEVVNIWLPDLKTLDNTIAKKIYRCSDYADVAKKALDFMINQSTEKYDESGVMLSGTNIRHLILPGHMESTQSILRWFAKHGQGKAKLSLLSQYTPVIIPGETGKIPQSYLSQREYDLVLKWLEEYQIEDGFIQELETGSDWLPDFRENQPFDSSLARIIWRAQDGPVG